MAQHRHIDRGERRDLREDRRDIRLTQETSDRTDAICGQMLVSVIEIFLSSEKTGGKEFYEQNCAATGEKSGATRVISGKTVGI